ncbi:hypothetical protein [Caulobacter sp. BK020]|uniref:hypothetical protein n=1 Tax=Caulobacter sp. BK020 TaxID=2512117 RepID=UPI0010D59FA0|nr:hypothetical protein [Caulobacter sp. BK020]TCS14574.1 hypothetical protein EV278_107223 [Caulobacter sp. BK020]
MTEPLFNASQFARELRLHMAGLAPLSQREAAAQAGVSAATFTRAMNVASDLSHENYLRLTAWMAAGQGGKVGRAA